MSLPSSNISLHFHLKIFDKQNIVQQFIPSKVKEGHTKYASASVMLDGPLLIIEYV